MKVGRILVSGGGIAGLTCAIELKRRGFEPLVIEREPALRRQGYMMDFFGTGWDVAERMGLVDRLQTVRYPIDAVEFVDAGGRPFLHVPVARVHDALNSNYVYLRRQDLEAILAKRAGELGVQIRYGMSIEALTERDDSVHIQFENGEHDTFSIVVGADGVHSRVRELMFGPEAPFARFLGLTVAAFHLGRGTLPVTHAATIYEETDRMAMVYPLDDQRLDATFILRTSEPYILHDKRMAFLRDHLSRGGWILPELVRAIPSTDLYFDGATQIAMPHWHRGRAVLIGDACGCLTLLAGQGSHMAMADAFVLAEELQRQGDHRAAFAAYQRRLKPHVDGKQRSAARWAGVFVPGPRSRPWLRRLALKLLFSRTLIRPAFRSFGSRSILKA